MPKRKYKPGQIVWARVADRNGIVKDQSRPVLITQVHPTVREAPLWGLAISTRRETDPEDPIVELPWDADTGSTTGLFKWCAVVLRWLVSVEQDAIDDVSGYISPELFSEIEQAVARARLSKGRRHSS